MDDLRITFIVPLSNFLKGSELCENPLNFPHDSLIS